MPANRRRSRDGVVFIVPKLSIIIPFYDAAATLGACLEALLGERETPMEIICVDDRSSDRSAEIAARYPVRLVQMIRRSGAAAARNLAASLATGDMLFFVDADVIVPPGVIERIAARFEREPQLDALFGAYTIFPAGENFATVYKNLVHHFTHLTSRRRATTFWCGCGAIRRECFAKSGGFDESYDAASVEDIDLGYRLHKMGAQVALDPDLRVIHAKHYTLPGLVRSDLLNRAVPWTRLMMRENIFTPDLNLRVPNIVSGILLVLVAPLALLLAFFVPWRVTAISLAGLICLYFLMNIRIWWYVFRLRGLAFSCLFLTMYSVTYVYSALGFALGIVLYLVEKKGMSRHE